MYFTLSVTQLNNNINFDAGKVQKFLWHSFCITLSTRSKVKTSLCCCCLHINYQSKLQVIEKIRIGFKIFNVMFNHKIRDQDHD